MSTPSPKHSEPNETLIHVDHLSLQYGEVEVFTDLCFTIDKGTFVSVVGPNGAGKTQLMRTLLGFNNASTGSIQRNFTIEDVGYVPQEVNIDPTFPITVREFLQAYIDPKRMWRSASLPELDPAVSVDSMLDMMIGNLSGGQTQRVLLAAALSTQPDVLFLDEFSAGIDPRGQAEIYSYLHKLSERDGMSIVMISHDIDMTTQYADTAICLNKRMVCHGHPHNVFNAKTFEQMYGLPLTKLSHHQHSKDPEHDGHV